MEQRLGTMIGVDLGSSGALVALDLETLDALAIIDMPTREESIYCSFHLDGLAEDRPEDATANQSCRTMESDVILSFIYQFRDRGPVFVCVERTFPVPHKSSSSMWYLGYYFGSIRNLLHGRGIPLFWAKENEWKGFFGIKQRGKLKDGTKVNPKKEVMKFICPLYPNADILNRTKNPKDGRTDALTVALYGAANYLGLSSEAIVKQRLDRQGDSCLI